MQPQVGLFEKIFDQRSLAGKRVMLVQDVGDQGLEATPGLGRNNLEVRVDLAVFETAFNFLETNQPVAQAFDRCQGCIRVDAIRDLRAFERELDAPGPSGENLVHSQIALPACAAGTQANHLA